MIRSLDHLVLTVTDLDATIDFYTRILGMAHVIFDGRHALRFGSQKINLHRHGHEFSPRAEHPIPGSADLCFLIDGTLEQAEANLHRNAVVIEDGPVDRTGATGHLRSLYIRDPDSNLIELSVMLPRQSPAGST
jgi:catechol 2,3-dioxygenase-like lactoylglutathione lyase family enzyme